MKKILQILRANKRIILLIGDIILISVALLLAFVFRFDGIIPPEYYSRFPAYIILALISNIYFIWRQGLYSFSWEFISLREALRLFKAITFANFIFALAVLASRETLTLFSGFPRTVILINYILDLILLGSIRISKRAWQEFTEKKFFESGEETLIVGASSEGEQILRNLLKNKNDIYYPIGIVDHRKDHQRTTIHGVQVLGDIEDIPKLVKSHNVKHVVIALSSVDAGVIRKATSLSREAGVKDIKIIPAAFEIISGQLRLTDIRGVQVEDLLGREPAKIDTGSISKFLKDKVVLVTGAAGSIGSEVVRQIVSFRSKKIAMLDFNESGLFDLDAEIKISFSQAPVKPIIANINDKEKIEKIIAELKPDVIFHSAAYKHVPLMEEFPEEAVETNIFGTLNVAEAAIKNNVDRFVFISTDKAIRPVSVMGQTKRVAELVVQNLGNKSKTKFVSVRFGNVIGSRGSVIPLFKEQIKRRLPVTVTHPEMTRYFMTIPEAALLVAEAGAVGKGGEIFMLDMGKPVRIFDLAKETIRLAGLEPDIDIPIVFTGVRPGEKIFEEIFSEDEKRIGATQWDKIFITKTEKPVEEKTLKKILENLKKALEQHNSSLVKETLREATCS